MHASDHSANLTLPLADSVATEALGTRLARTLRPGLVLWLSGDLGVGKTTLARGLLRGLGFHGRVKSPTFSLVEIYPFSSFNLYHFDLYRFTNPEDWLDAGFREYFDPTAVCLVEWPERGEGVLPAPDVLIRLDFAGEGGAHRQAELGAWTEAGRGCVDRLRGRQSSG